MEKFIKKVVFNAVVLVVYWIIASLLGYSLEDTDAMFWAGFVLGKADDLYNFIFHELMQKPEKQ